MITVLHVIDTGGPGGAETVFLNTVAGLDAQCFRSICIVSRDGWLADSLRARGIDPTIESASGSFNFNYLRAIRSLLKRHKVNLVAAHLYGSAVYCSLGGMLERIPVVSILHGQSDIAGKGRLSWLKRWLVRTGSSRTVFVSNRLRDELATALALPARKCTVIPNGIDIDKFEGSRDTDIRRELGVNTEHILVGAVGNIRKPKSYDVLIKAAAILRGRSDRYRFAIAGEGSGTPYNDLLKLRSELKLDDVVTFLGLRSDISKVLRNYDIYALSSTTEGFSIACVEAMASRVPVVATRSGGPEEILENGHSGLLVPTNDPTALADAIERLANDRMLAAQLATNGRETAANRYSLNTMLQAYERLFAETAKS